MSFYEVVGFFSLFCFWHGLSLQPRLFYLLVRLRASLLAFPPPAPAPPPPPPSSSSSSWVLPLPLPLPHLHLPPPLPLSPSPLPPLSEADLAFSRPAEPSASPMFLLLIELIPSCVSSSPSPSLGSTKRINNIERQNTKY
ncbi:vegetative cell wall protein gp1-like [Ananas comosus]|uniref:Vegetative cell wall protein gp1-like n=1 Tax=Ananas comosus TaxID=4615 RepID=A0A6P5F8B7_ANACO|nr:vegetative cell wall protein gp1-like [Ananas comosus]